MAKDKDDQSATPDPGIFITQGMQVTIPSFSIRIKDDGSIEVDPVTLHTGLDLCPYWIEIALMHLEESEKAREALLTGKLSQNSEAIAKALRDDFTAGMQTIMASAIAIDAYYSNIKERSSIPDKLVQTWKKNGTARYKQVAEVFRRAFLIPEKPANQLRDILKEIFSFRDKAVHPPSGTTAAVLHPELNKVSDWRYATFRNYNARAIVKMTLSIVDQTSRKPNTEKHKKLELYCQAVVAYIDPLVKRWEQKYGKLYD
jgi:hypothetical protein